MRARSSAATSIITRCTRTMRWPRKAVGTRSTVRAAPIIAEHTGATAFTKTASRARSSRSRNCAADNNMNSRIYKGWVEHRRAAPRRNRFRYPLFMLYIDLAELPELFDGTPFWSARRPALAWFKRSDYLGGGALPLDAAV